MVLGFVKLIVWNRCFLLSLGLFPLNWLADTLTQTGLRKWWAAVIHYFWSGEAASTMMLRFNVSRWLQNICSTDAREILQSHYETIKRRLFICLCSRTVGPILTPSGQKLNYTFRKRYFFKIFIESHFNHHMFNTKAIFALNFQISSCFVIAMSAVQKHKRRMAVDQILLTAGTELSDSLKTFILCF